MMCFTFHIVPLEEFYLYIEIDLKRDTLPCLNLKCSFYFDFLYAL